MIQTSQDATNKPINLLVMMTIASSLVSAVLFHVGLVLILALTVITKSEKSVTLKNKVFFILIVQFVFITTFRRTIVDWQMTLPYLEDVLRWGIISSIVLFWAKKNIKINLLTLIKGAAIALYLSGIVASYQHFVMNLERSGGSENPINFAIFLTMFSLIIIIYLRRCWKNTALNKAILIALPFGLLAIMLSGSRGPMLTYIVATTCYLIFTLRHSLHQKTVKLGIFFSLLLLTGLFSIYSIKSGIIEQSIIQFNVWQETQAMSQIGARFEMWLSAIDIFLRYPIYGAGEMVRVLQAQGGVYLNFNTDVTKFAHVHSEMFDALSKYGAIGFISIWTVWLIPIIMVLAKQIKIQTLEFELLLAVSLVWFLGGLTQVLTHHTSGLTLLPFVYVAINALRADKSSDEASDAPTAQ